MSASGLKVYVNLENVKILMDHSSVNVRHDINPSTMGKDVWVSIFIFPRMLISVRTDNL